jgi:hypothetical protein
MLLVQFLGSFRMFFLWILFAGPVFRNFAGFLLHALESFTGGSGVASLSEKMLRLRLRAQGNDCEAKDKRTAQ